MKNIFGNSFIINQEVNIIGKKTEVKTKGKSWPDIYLNNTAEPVNIPAIVSAALGALPACSGAQNISPVLMAALGAIGTAGTIQVTQNQTTGQYNSSYILSLMKVLNGAYAKSGNLSEEELKKLIMLMIKQMLEKAGPGFSQWNQVLIELMQSATLTDFMKGVQSAVCAITGDPVNANTGNFIYEKEDIHISATVPLCFKRTYNRIDKREGCMGDGWRHNYEIELLIENDRYVIIWEDGREEIYIRLEEGGIKALFGCICRLEEKEMGYWYKTQEGMVYIFDEKGRLTAKNDTNGRGLCFTYGRNGKLECVSNGYGIRISYGYESVSGRLISVTDHTGRSITLGYEMGRLCYVTNAGGESYCYYYDNDKTLYRIQNPRGVMVLENEYDDQGRTLCQHFADGGKIFYDYQEESNRSLVTEQNGSKVAYIHDERFRNIKTVYEDGEERFAYNERNQMIQYVDKNGNKTRFSYDDKGNMSQVIYPDGSKNNMTYDANNRLLMLSVNGIEKLKNVYDSKGNLLRTSDALNRHREFEYDKSGNVIQVKQPDGSVTSLEYDSRGNITSFIDEAGRQLSYEYDDSNRVIGTVDGNGYCTRFAYDNCDRIFCVTNAQGKRRIYEYTKNGKVTKVIDFNGAVASQKYNCMNQVEAYNGPDGEVLSAEYDLMQNVIRRILPNGAELVYTYDGLNRMEQMTLPMGGVIYYEYDPNGNRTAVTDPNGNRTVMEYDERNRITKVTDPSGASTQYEYDMEGHLINVTNAMGKSHTYVYDEAGQLISETDVLGNKTCYDYNALGKLTCVIDPEKRKTIYEYAQGGDLSRTIYPDGTFETYLYDKNGNLIRRQNHKEDFLEIIYDCLNQPITVKSSFGQEKRYTYNAVGKVTSVTDTLGHVTRYLYSPGGKLTYVIDAAGNRTEYAYDALGMLITICQHQGKEFLLNGADQKFVNDSECKNHIHITQYERNLAGEIETITNPLGLQEHYTYDLAGQMILKKDREGYETYYAFHPSGDIEKVTYGDGRSVAFSYNSLRQLTEIQDWLGITRIEPDEIGRAKKITDYKGREISYQWGKMGERKSLVYPNGHKISYEYDELARLNRLTDGEREISYCYDEDGHLSKKIFPDDIISNYSYNSRGLLESLIHQQNGELLEKYEYEYDLMGNKTAIGKRRRAVSSLSCIPAETERRMQEESGNYEYRYDSMNRLIEVRKDRKRISQYEYDAFGNRVGRQTETKNIRYHYNAANQLIHEEGIFPEQSYQYDARGNLTTILQGEITANQYVYDETNRLAAAFHEKGQAVRYEYDGLGNRVGRKEYDFEKTNFFSQFQAGMMPVENPAREVEYLLDLTKQYYNLLEKTESEGNDVHAQSYIWDNNTAFMTEGGGTHIYLQDELGSTVRLVERQEKGQMVYGYDEFGQDLYGNQGEIQPFGYTGYQKDRIANTYFAQAREYLPGIGRFAGEDIIKGSVNQPFTFNAYGYCWENPINLVDLNGNKPEDPEKSDQILHLSINAGTGVKAKVKVLGVGAEIGLLRYYTFDSLDVNEWTESMNLGGAVDVTPFLNGEVGVTGTKYASSGKHKENIVYANVQIGGIAIGTDSGEKDIILSNSIGAYLGVGGEINLDINLSAIIRKIPTTPYIVIGPVANPSNATKGVSSSTSGSDKKNPTIPYIVIGPVANPSNATKCEASN
jgi:RHS repeat-associated protein